ncbi:serine protease inhibitor 77Ba-like [Episyrphus balteatus]|uniref:serine protease inhibitor 77Ba-like n=1 Tax=Episyrphus balteatus TaxID=286459 RepID=UPI002485FEC3|nr:serine protease inhibitor 77Ba-like [Episyrphus balteatus]
MMWKQGFMLLACFATVIFAQGLTSWGSSGAASTSNRPTTSPAEYLRTVSKGTEDFSLELFSTVCREIAGIKANIMISPFTVWALLLLVTEGSSNTTLTELQQTLRISDNQEFLRESYRTIEKSLKVNTSTVTVSTMQTIFRDMNRPFKRDFEDVIEQQYQANVKPIDFFEQQRAQAEIADYIEKATRGLIKPNIDLEDLQDAQMIMISSIFFKGQWKLPFNASFTKTEPFYDDDGNVIGQVQMMTQTAVFNYAPIVEMQSHIVELPYGKEDRLSMLLIVPKRGVRINDAIDNLRKVGLERIFTEFENKDKNKGEYDEDEVEVFLPKFTTTTSLILNGVLEKMGIRDVFQPNYANLTKMSEQPLYLSRVIHQTKIEVSEEGTVAAAITAGIFANKASPPRFYLNKPFAYLIVEKTTRTLLFCGQVTKPK